MADQIDIAPNVAGALQLESIGNIQIANATGRDMTVTANNILKATAVRNFDELSVVEGKTSAGVLATDVGGPSNAGKP